MSETETWVQQYRRPRHPGPDGQPSSPEPSWYPSDMELQWRNRRPYLFRVDHNNVKWRRYFDWKYSSDFRDNYE